MQGNKLIDLFDKYKSNMFAPLTAQDRQNMINVEPAWQQFLAKKGLTNKFITRNEFGNLCVEFMSFLMIRSN